MASFLTACHEVEVGSENSERLVDTVSVGWGNDNLGVGVIAHLLSHLIQDACTLTELRNLGKEWNLHVGQVVPCLDSGIQLADHEEDTERNTCAEDKCYKHNHLLVRRLRHVFSGRLHHKTCIANVHETGDFIFLSLLKEIDIKFLLDLLLTLDGEQLKFLTGSVGNLVHDIGLLCSDLVSLKFEGRDKVLDRPVDGYLQCCNGVVVVEHERVFAAAS